MKKRQQIGAIVLFVLLALVFVGIWRTRNSELLTPPPVVVTSAPSAAQLLFVDQSPLKLAQELAQLPASPDERPFARESIRLSDFAVDLAFDTALLQARLHPLPLTQDAIHIRDRLQKAEKLRIADEDRTRILAEKLAKAPEDKRESLELDLIQAEADLDLDQDEIDDARLDLDRAGGNFIERIQTLRKEHEEVAHGSAAALSAPPEAPEKFGLLHRAQQWLVLRDRQSQIIHALDAALDAASALTAEHNLLESRALAAKAATPGLAQHAAKSASASAPSSTPEPAPHKSAADSTSQESSALLAATEQLAADQKTITSLDKRIEAYKELAAVYSQWISYLDQRRERVVHRMLFGAAIILVIALLGLYINSWSDSVIGRLPADRRQVESLRTISRVFHQFIAAILVLLVIFGPPTEIGTFIGFATAGLTVALKDFIVSFVGWFMLMRRNGIRLGDWVEINGVTGEVVQITPFHTVLLETGNWSDSGQPTGRRVTFTNAFAIEGHYFNFSTSGPWLWDELQVMLPATQDPYPIVEALQEKVTEATRDSAAQAEAEWRHASTSEQISSFSAAPAISMRPILGGVEIGVRYITRANEKFKIRTELSQTAVALVASKGGKVS